MAAMFQLAAKGRPLPANGCRVTSRNSQDGCRVKPGMTDAINLIAFNTRTS